MLTFSQFRQRLDETVVATTRESIIHLQGMKDVEFIHFMRSVKSELKGKLKNIPVALKVDGFGFRVGKNESGKVFVESSRSGPIFDSGAFTAFNKSKGVTDPIILERSAHYDDVLEHFKSSKFAAVLPVDSKVVVETLYNPLGKEEHDWIQFVSVKYDKSKLGSLMTLFPLKVLVSSTGETHPDEANILKSLYATSNDSIKVLNPTLRMKEIDISGFLSPLDSITDRTIEIINSRKAVDKEEKLAVKAMLQKLKDELAEYIISHQNIQGKDMIGKNLEGIVMKISDKLVKITTTEFKNRVKS
jgi:hypothetical protein